MVAGEVCAQLLCHVQGAVCCRCVPGYSPGRAGGCCSHTPLPSNGTCSTMRDSKYSSPRDSRMELGPDVSGLARARGGALQEVSACKEQAGELRAPVGA